MRKKFLSYNFRHKINKNARTRVRIKSDFKSRDRDCTLVTRNCASARLRGRDDHYVNDSRTTRVISAAVISRTSGDFSPERSKERRGANPSLPEQKAEIKAFVVDTHTIHTIHTSESNPLKAPHLSSPLLSSALFTRCQGVSLSLSRRRFCSRTKI